MNKQPRLVSVFALMATLIAFSSTAGAAGKAGQPSPVEPYGIGVTPAVYLINFMLMYIANPNEAANMPAYRTPIPLDLSNCLNDNPLHPEACTYSTYALSFVNQPFVGSANQNKKCSLPTQCRTDPKWEQLAPAVSKHPDQINEPLGMNRANSIAQSLSIDKRMILTDREYQCTIGLPPRNDDRKIIFACLKNLTNSNGNTNIPLSSYGLALNDEGDVQSLCAPDAPCLVFNDLFFGPLERIAEVCGWGMKLKLMLSETPFPDLIKDANTCQQDIGGASENGACLAEPVCQ